MADPHDGEKAERPAGSAASETQAVKAPEAKLEKAGSGKDIGAFEATRTHASDGSLRDRLSLAAEQEDSIEISFPGGRASRTNQVTERDINAKQGEHLVDSPISSPADSGGDYSVERTGPKSFALGVQFQEGRSAYDKLCDFVGAATQRASDPSSYSRYLQDEMDKFVGIGEGLNIAKEETKSTAAHAWVALTDGTVANFLAKPNAINEPMFKVVASVFEALKNDPGAVDKTLHALGLHLMQESEEYSAMTPREQGQVIGKTAFNMVNPEGSTEAGEAALKVVDNLATHVDAAVLKGVEKAHKAVQELATSSPAIAAQTKQMLLDYTSKIGLTGPQLQLAGIPDRYFAGMTAGADAAKSENYLAMARPKNLRGDTGAGLAGGRELPEIRELSAAERQELALRAREYALNLVEAAKAAEEDVTTDLTALAKIHGGELVGLNNKLKTVDSLTRKIEHGTRPQDVKDALRYTLVFSDEQLTDSAKAVIKSLSNDNYELLKLKNTFKRGESYKGVNCCFRNESGQLFELQFHTAGSFDLKQENHPLYELARELVEYDGKTNKKMYFSNDVARAALQKHKGVLDEFPHLSKIGDHFYDPAMADTIETRNLFEGIERQLIDRCAQYKNPQKIGTLLDINKFGD